MTTLPQSSSKLSMFNRKYLALKRQIDKDRQHFKYNPALVDQMTAVRNDIIELQAARRTSAGGERIWM